MAEKNSVVDKYHLFFILPSAVGYISRFCNLVTVNHALRIADVKPLRCVDLEDRRIFIPQTRSRWTCWTVPLLLSLPMHGSC